jgi:hypothetical protein
MVGDLNVVLQKSTDQAEPSLTSSPTTDTLRRPPESGLCVLQFRGQRAVDVAGLRLVEPVDEGAGQREPIALRRSRIARAPACESAGARRRR